ETWNAGIGLSSAQFSQSGQAVLVAGEQGIARVWDRESGKSVLDTRHDALSPPQFLRDGRAVLIARASTASIIQIDTRQPAGRRNGRRRHDPGRAGESRWIADRDALRRGHARVVGRQRASDRTI